MARVWSWWLPDGDGDVGDEDVGREDETNDDPDGEVGLVWERLDEAAVAELELGPKLVDVVADTCAVDESKDDCAAFADVKALRPLSALVMTSRRPTLLLAALDCERAVQIRHASTPNSNIESNFILLVTSLANSFVLPALAIGKLGVKSISKT
jgi:hypothetical protein